MTRSSILRCFLLLIVVIAACSGDDPVAPQNRAPAAPSIPVPTNNAIVGINAELSWEASDADGDPLTFDVYFGEADPPPLAVSNVDQATYDPGTLGFDKTYRWQIAVKDNSGAKSTGPVWSFLTTNNRAPSVMNSAPADNSVNQDASGIQLSWNGDDPEGDPLTYTVLLDTQNPPIDAVATDISNSSFNTGRLDMAKDYYWRVRVRDSFLNTFESEVWSFTTRGPTALTLAGTGDLPAGSRANAVTVDGDYAYVAGLNSGVHIVDVGNAEAPTWDGRYDHKTGILDIASHVSVVGNTAYIGYGSQGFVIANVTSKTTPTLIGDLRSSGVFAMGLVVSGNSVYLANGDRGLGILNISAPSSPSIVGAYTPTPDAGFARNLVVSGTTVYMVNEIGLLIIDVSNPRTPTLTNSVVTRGDAWDIDLLTTGKGGGVKKYALIADDEQGVHIIDLTSIGPQTVTFPTAGGAARSIVIDGSHAYVADGTAGLQVLDLSLPMQPRLDAFYDTPDEATGVWVAGNYVYIADQLGELIVVDRTPLVAK